MDLKLVKSINENSFKIKHGTAVSSNYLTDLKKRRH